MLGHNFHEDVMVQTRKILLWIYVLFVYWKKQTFDGIGNFFLLKSVQNINDMYLN